MKSIVLAMLFLTQSWSHISRDSDFLDRPGSLKVTHYSDSSFNRAKTIDENDEESPYGTITVVKKVRKAKIPHQGKIKAMPIRDLATSTRTYEAYSRISTKEAPVFYGQFQSEKNNIEEHMYTPEKFGASAEDQPKEDYWEAALQKAWQELQKMNLVMAKRSQEKGNNENIMTNISFKEYEARETN